MQLVVLNARLHDQAERVLINYGGKIATFELPALVAEKRYGCSPIATPPECAHDCIGSRATTFPT